MTKALRGKLKHFLRGAGSVIALWPDTRQNRGGGEVTFGRTVFINGRKVQLGVRHDVLEETDQAFASDWKKLAGDVSKSILRLPETLRADADRRFAKQ